MPTNSSAYNDIVFSSPPPTPQKKKIGKREALNYGKQSKHSDLSIELGQRDSFGSLDMDNSNAKPGVPEFQRQAQESRGKKQKDHA